jgi:hypothetical protein
VGHAQGVGEILKLDPYAEAKRLHPSSLPPLAALGDDERDGRGAVVLAFPVPVAG